MTRDTDSIDDQIIAYEETALTQSHWSLTTPELKEG